MFSCYFQESKYTYIPVQSEDEPTLLNYTAQYRKNELRLKHFAGESQAATAHVARADRPNPNSEKLCLFLEEAQHFLVNSVSILFSALFCLLWQCYDATMEVNGGSTNASSCDNNRHPTMPERWIWTFHIAGPPRSEKERHAHAIPCCSTSGATKTKQGKKVKVDTHGMNVAEQKPNSKMGDDEYLEEFVPDSEVHNAFSSEAKFWKIVSYLYKMTRRICLDGEEQDPWFYKGTMYLISKYVPNKGAREQALLNLAICREHRNQLFTTWYDVEKAFDSMVGYIGKQWRNHNGEKYIAGNPSR
ncbi:unnamed protein product [Thelazia callipaeda]|uniref:Reverse transcriptase domain-containing protein n=1 Tax=Thelazia callipaeda TaxID=103827 RepID=A0A0N5D531_THECL|nr:unnamed protein product [Thelazia callipaeda]